MQLSIVRLLLDSVLRLLMLVVYCVQSLGFCDALLNFNMYFSHDGLRNMTVKLPIVRIILKQNFKGLGVRGKVSSV